ncbi:ComEA family DNA-binding protein [Luteimicrobium subarcticum]|uniref:Competence protein ComEA n=1 Tax=Luteimicrobium subarcticum TaxID=620910 RepID=A0A2M8WQY2_9MICO|nr:ComEA family DNA-binding protein [Luteimicrobium subarcticum]PJI93341.1 competence protein ComEA [Luteimicrobium subarcticum]
MPISRPAAALRRGEPARRHVGRPRPGPLRDRGSTGDARDRGLRLADGRPLAPVVDTSVDAVRDGVHGDPSGGAVDASAPDDWSPVLHDVPAGAVAADPDPDADLATRWRQGALTAVATAYGSAHGHPLTPHETRPAPRRWTLDVRTAAVALAALVAVAAAVVAVAVGRGAGDPILGAAPAVSFPAPAAEAAPGSSGGGTQRTPGAGGDTGAAAGSAVVVDVVGAVRHPGVRTLTTGARVADAIAAAGGATGAADVEQLNLARPVVDGEQVRVPRHGEQLVLDGATPAAGGGGGTGGAADGATGTTAPGPGLVDLNTADVATLDGLPGIGPVIAQRIVDRRTQVGAFTSVDQLEEVSGVGPVLLAKVRDLVRV